MKFLGSFRKSLKPTKALGSDVLSSLTKPSSGLKLFDDTFGSLDFKVVNSHVTANGVPLHAIERLLRRGELIEMFNKLKKTHTFNITDEVKFRQLLDTPDLKMRDMELNIKQNKIFHPDLDIKVSSVSDIEKLPAATKTKLNNIIDKIKKTATTGAVLTGLLGAIVIGSDMYANMVAATHSRNGLYVLVKTNNKTVSYKLTSRSCINQDIPNGSTAYKGKLELDNIGLYLLYAINDDSKAKTVVENLLGIEVKMSNFESILKNSTYVEKLTDYYYSTTYSGPKNIPSPCKVASYISSNIPSCIAWNPSASVDSLEYYNTYEMPDNMTLECVTNSTLLETIVDALGDTASSILNPTSAAMAGVWKYILYAIVAVISIVLLGAIIKFAKPKSPTAQGYQILN